MIDTVMERSEDDSCQCKVDHRKLNDASSLADWSPGNHIVYTMLVVISSITR